MDNVPEFRKICAIDFSDDYLELVPEAYLDSKLPSSKEIEKEMDKLVRESVAFIIRAKRENNFSDES